MALKKFTQTAGRAAASWGSNKVSGAIGGISNPLLRGAAGSLLTQQVLPGFGGSSTNFRDTAFNQLIRQRVALSQSELTGLADDQLDRLEGQTEVQKSYDWRARLRPKNGGADQFYQAAPGEDALMRPLKESNGLVWQYTPSVFMATTADYTPTSGQGQNYQHNTFSKRSVQNITITGDFTANDIYEGRYMLGVLAFLRAATMAYYGELAKEKAGTPPPVLIFEYMGDHGFNQVPVVVDSYNLQLPENVDYVPIEIAGKVTYVPTDISIATTLRPTYTPEKLRKKFNLEDISSGKSYRDGFI